MATPTLDQLVTEAEQWFRDTMHNSVVARDVAVYNHIHSAFEELKGRIVTLFTSKPQIAPQPAAEPEAEAPASDFKIKPAA